MRVPLSPAQRVGATMLRKAGGYARVSGDGQIPPAMAPPRPGSSATLTHWQLRATELYFLV